MFQAGQKIVYPLHGAGYIEEIEGTENGEYYIIRIPTGNVMIRIPKDGAEKSGIRLPEERNIVEETLVRVGKSRPTLSDNWNLRQKENFCRLKTGKLDRRIACKMVRKLILFLYGKVWVFYPFAKNGGRRWKNEKTC